MAVSPEFESHEGFIASSCFVVDFRQ